jgi:hypothetical protein
MKISNIIASMSSLFRGSSLFNPEFKKIGKINFIKNSGTFNAKPYVKVVNTFQAKQRQKKIRASNR